ncbi:MAG: TRAP transporter large permease subunit [Acidimicrobiales bacterium]
MSPNLILLTSVVVLVVMILSEVPVSFSLLTAGSLGLILLNDRDYTYNTLANDPYSTTASFTLMLIPMFVVMGMLVVQAGIASDVYGFAARVLGRFPAGLGYATVAACAGFAAVTGSSAATVATVGRISINEMRKHGYSAAFASGIVAASGTLGILIPPSVVLVIYGVLTGESIGELLLAGFIPGVISAFLYALVVWFRARTEVGPQFVAEDLDDVILPVRSTNLTQLSSAFKVLVLFFIVVGGIYTGAFTATESGAVAAAVALLMLIWTGVRRGGLDVFRLLRQAFEETTEVTSMVFFLLIGGGIFSFFMVSGGYARDFSEWITELGVNRYMILILFLLALIPLGMLLDGLSILLITVPLIYPVVMDLGFNGLWLGILMVKMIELSLITPPVGINVYVVVGAAPGLKIEDAFRGIWPFGLMDLATIALLFSFPSLTTWLPQVAG